MALDFALADVVEVAIVGDADRPGHGATAGRGRTGYRPDLVVACAADPASSAVELLSARFRSPIDPTAFVCRQFACRQPVDEPEALAAQLVG